MSIKSWIILFINSLIVVTTAIVTFFFYVEFERTLNERVLLQLISIKRLKRLQIENYLKDKWESLNEQDSAYFEHKNIALQAFSDSLNFVRHPEGVYDVTSIGGNGHLLLLFVKKGSDQNLLFKLDKADKIQEILLERTGMGQSGETYIVGDDFRLRSESRFYHETPPYEIEAKTIGVIASLDGSYGKQIIRDYRNKEVFSAYHYIKYSKLKWAILSEIDVDEVTEPLDTMRKKLFIANASVLFFVVIISLILTNKITGPIGKVSRLITKMAGGQYAVPIEPSGLGTEVQQLFNALLELQRSMVGAVEFATEIGTMNLEASYSITSKNDRLGNALVAMRDQLKEFKEEALKHQKSTKLLLIKGQEEERRRLSRELHDGLGPLLTSLKLVIQSTEIDSKAKADLKGKIDTIIEEVRRISYALMPQSLLDFGIGKVIQHWINSVNKSTGLDIHYRDLTDDTHALPQEINICLYRIIQEMLTNTIKHAHASEVKLSLTEFENKVSLYYYDNGKGFDINQSYSGSGLLNIKERIEVLNGYYTINSDKHGTEIEVEIPLNSSHD